MTKCLLKGHIVNQGMNNSPQQLQAPSLCRAVPPSLHRGVHVTFMACRIMYFGRNVDVNIYAVAMPLSSGLSTWQRHGNVNYSFDANPWLAK